MVPVYLGGGGTDPWGGTAGSRRPPSPPHYLKKGFLRSSRLLDLEPV